jgi:hypothetical protein
MQTSRHRAATDGFGPVQNLMQDATFVAMGGKRTFSAGLNRSNSKVESRHPHSLESQKSYALPQGGSEPNV